MALGDLAKRHSGNLAFVLLVAAVVFTFGAIAIAGHNFTSLTGSGIGPTGNPPTTANSKADAQSSCGVPRVAGSCKVGQPQWITLRSQAPADIIAAARQSTLFRVDRSGNGDYVKDLSHLGSPKLVLALRTGGWTATTMPDFYILPVSGPTGATIAAAELALNPTHTAIQVIAIVTYTKALPHDTIGRMSMRQSLAAISAQRHVALRASAQPHLVYFPVNTVSQQTGKIIWLAGGEYPADPIWMIPGADGKTYVVG
ncbi:MAG: hypothetical protein ABI068_15000, partial [Ktedonobacterales bacterium]